jgi:micrococcal nuclease
VGLKALLCSAFLLVCIPASSVDYTRVKHVIDGDTVILQNGEKVRLIGINTPEMKRGSSREEPLALAAKLALQSIVMGEKITVRVGIDARDRYGRLLAYLTREDDVDVQEAMLRRGYAQVIAVPPNVERITRYLEVERVAKSERLGIWRQAANRLKNVDLTPLTTTGFFHLMGTVRAVEHSRKTIFLVITERLSLSIRRVNWNEYWRGRPERLVGETVTTRGWVNRYRKKYVLSVSHPTMLQVQ